MFDTTLATILMILYSVRYFSKSLCNICISNCFIILDTNIICFRFIEIGNIHWIRKVFDRPSVFKMLKQNALSPMIEYHSLLITQNMMPIKVGLSLGFDTISTNFSEIQINKIYQQNVCSKPISRSYVFFRHWYAKIVDITSSFNTDSDGCKGHMESRGRFNIVFFSLSRSQWTILFSPVFIFIFSWAPSLLLSN